MVPSLRVAMLLASLLVGLSACAGGDDSKAVEQLRAELAELRQQTLTVCRSAGEWAPAAQEWLFASNDTAADFERYLLGIREAFAALGNVLLPLVQDAVASRLLPLMRRWRAEVETWMSSLSRGTDAGRERAPLRMNGTIQDVNPLLVTECSLEPLLLYQARPE